MKALSIEKIWFYIILLISMFPILPKGAESILMFLFFIFSTIIYFKNDKRFDIKITGIISISFLFFLYLITSFYAENSKENLKFIILTLPLLLFPLTLGLFTRDLLNHKKVELIKIVFVFSTFLSLLVTHLFLFFSLSNDITQWEYRNAFEDFTKVHGTYFSLWIGFGSILLLDYFLEIFKNNNSKFRIIISLFIISYFIYWQIKIGARLPFSITLLLMLISIVKFQKPEFRKKIFIILLILSTIIIILKFNFIIKKFNVSLPEGKYELKHKTMTSEEIRAGIYFCSFTLIKESWLFGYGIGDVNDRLNLCYKDKIKSDVYQIFHYNSHNQYLQVFLTGGFFSFLFFIIGLYHLLKTAISKKDKSFLFFLIFMIGCFFTENILSRHDGILFYSFFSSILYFKK